MATITTKEVLGEDCYFKPW